MIGVSVGGKPVKFQAVIRPAAGDHIDYRRRSNRSQHLENHIRYDVFARETPSSPQTDRDRGVQMAAGEVADGVGHGDDSEPESQRHTKKPDAGLGKGGRQHGTPAAAKYQPK